MASWTSGNLLAPWCKSDPSPSRQVPLQPHGLLERLVGAHPRDHRCRLHLHRGPPGMCGCPEGRQACSQGEGEPPWSKGGAGFSQGLVVSCTAGARSQDGRSSGFCPILECFPPDPVRAILLLGPTADCLFQKLLLWFLLPILYSLRLRSVPRLTESPQAD